MAEDLITTSPDSVPNYGGIGRLAFIIFLVGLDSLVLLCVVDIPRMDIPRIEDIQGGSITWILALIAGPLGFIIPFVVAGFVFAALGLTGLLVFAIASSQPNYGDAIPVSAFLWASLASIVVVALVVYRRRNIGKTGWYALLALIPLVGGLVIVPCLYQPPGYADTRKLDIRGKIILGVAILSVFPSCLLMYWLIFR